MPEGNKNIDSYLDDKFNEYLFQNVSQDFSYELMKRVEIEKEFAKEDVKTYRLVKVIISLFLFLMSSFALIFTSVMNTNEESKDVGFLSGIINKFSDIIQTVSIFTTENLGFTFEVRTGIIVLLIMFCVFLFSIADKIVFNKSYK